MWIFDGFARVTSSLDSESAVTWIVPTQTTLYVSTEASDDAYIGNLNARPIGVITQYARATRDNTMCVFGINPSNSQVVAIADNRTASALATVGVPSVNGVTTLVTMKEAGMGHTCDVAIAPNAISASAPLVSTPNRIGIFARSASAHFRWAMIVTSP
jgi:hypothetical protein